MILVDNDVGIFTAGLVPRISIEAIDAQREVRMARLAADEGKNMLQAAVRQQTGDCAARFARIRQVERKQGS